MGNVVKAIGNGCRIAWCWCVDLFKRAVAYCREKAKIYWKPFLILLIIYLAAMLPLILADGMYMDDGARTYQLYGFPTTFSRYLEKYLSYFLWAGRQFPNISPLPQLLAAVLNAVNALLALRILTGKQKYKVWEYAATLPMALSPYFMECMSYQYDSCFISLSVTFCLVPFLFLREDGHGKLLPYGIASFVCILCMLLTYQAAWCVYPMVVALLCLLYWNRGDSYKSVGKFLLISVISCVLATLCFWLIYLATGDTLDYADPTLSLSLSSVLEEYEQWFEIAYTSLLDQWVLLFVVLAVFFIIATVVSSKRQKWLAGIFSVLILGITFILSFGLYPWMSTTADVIRYLSGVGIWMAFIAILAVQLHRDVVAKIAAIALGWCLFVFQYIYGNVVEEQIEYGESIEQALIDDLNEMDLDYDSGEIVSQYEGSIGYSPTLDNYSAEIRTVIQNICVRKFVTIRPPWNSATGEIDMLFNMTRASEDLTEMDLPLVMETYYYNIYADDTHVLIELLVMEL